MPRKGKLSVDKKQNKRIRRLEKKVGGIEIKSDIDSDFNVTDGNVIPLMTAAVPLVLGNIAQGDTLLTRTGNRIQVKHIDFLANLKNTDVNAQQVRLIIFYWKSDTAPALSDVMNIAAAGAGVPDSVTTPVNPVSVMNKWIHVLYDKTFYLEGTTEDSGSRLKIVRFRKRVDKPQLYSDTAGGDCKTGFWYLIGSTANNTTISQACRVDFTDI